MEQKRSPGRPLQPREAAEILDAALRLDVQTDQRRGLDLAGLKRIGAEILPPRLPSASGLPQ